MYLDEKHILTDDDKNVKKRSFIIYAKTDNFYKDIADDVKNRYDTSYYGVDRPLPKGMNKKVIGLMKDELGG